MSVLLNSANHFYIQGKQYKCVSFWFDCLPKQLYPFELTENS